MLLFCQIPGAKRVKPKISIDEMDNITTGTEKYPTGGVMIWTGSDFGLAGSDKGY